MIDKLVSARVFSVVFFLTVVAGGHMAQANGLDPDVSQVTQADKGHAIATEAAVRDTGFEDFSARVEMVLSNRNGTKSRRSLRISVLEVEDDGDKSLIVFDRPRDIYGTALLTFSHKNGNDDQWIYLPALKRIKRISSTNRSGPFVGSEFAYEDMVWPEIEKFDYRWLRDVMLDGIAAHVVERVPNYKNSGYSRQLVWYDQAELRIIRIEFFDRREDLLKVLTITGYQQYRDVFWRADKMHMTNMQSGKSTRLIWRNYSFSNGLSDRDLQKGRLLNLR